jgi:hypothetical protein
MTILPPPWAHWSDRLSGLVGPARWARPNRLTRSCRPLLDLTLILSSLSRLCVASAVAGVSRPSPAVPGGVIGRNRTALLRRPFLSASIWKISSPSLVLDPLLQLGLRYARRFSSRRCSWASWWCSGLAGSAPEQWCSA